ncbi:MAG: hypothetical protein ACFB0B_03915 [Thermonemataceae bacterium]
MEFSLDSYVTISNEKFDQFKIPSIKEFIIRVLKENSIGIGFKEIQQYIKLLEQCSLEEGNKNSNGISSGIFMNFKKETGITYFIFNDLDFLNQRVRLEKEIIQEMTIPLNKKKGKKRDFWINM